MKAIQIETFGSPAKVVKAVDVPDVGAPAPAKLMIAGSYGYRPRLPAIMGTEGAGRIIAVGAGVKHVKEGDRTLVPFPHPAWAERIKTAEADDTRVLASLLVSVSEAG